jgi:hypothetical protein
LTQFPGQTVLTLILKFFTKTVFHWIPNSFSYNPYYTEKPPDLSGGFY